MKYIYTAVITPSEDGTCFYVKVPDLDGCITTGNTLEDAIEQIQDAASVWLVVAEDNDDFISEPTVQSKIAHDKNSLLSLITVDTIAYRAAY